MPSLSSVEPAGVATVTEFGPRSNSGGAGLITKGEEYANDCNAEGVLWRRTIDFGPLAPLLRARVNEPHRKPNGEPATGVGPADSRRSGRRVLAVVTMNRPEVDFHQRVLAQLHEQVIPPVPICYAPELCPHPLELTQLVAVLPKQFLRRHRRASVFWRSSRRKPATVSARLGICAGSKSVSGCSSRVIRHAHRRRRVPDHMNLESGVVSLPARIRRVLLSQPTVAAISPARVV